jgi:hypothetical protein
MYGVIRGTMYLSLKKMKINKTLENVPLKVVGNEKVGGGGAAKGGK